MSENLRPVLWSGLMVWLLVGCATVTEDEFQRQPFEAEQVVTDDYLTIYRRTLSGARVCTSGEGLDDQLYEEKRYGEIYVFAHVFEVHPRLLIRIEDRGGQTAIKVKTADTVGRKGAREQGFKWARGYRGC
ncbi:hypothetical protein [Oceaniglobus trochenteri]|uniref:hypothetical protein n=1 Tax=Oceaniglobus trochenteri TaxID=2763260 RepID=UPI001D000DDF|nr:hypothetical protein [Oceaniglobus trochenteri]